MKLQIMSPAADRVDYKVPPAPRLSGLQGKTIGLYNNMTGGADIAVDRVAEHIDENCATSGGHRAPVGGKGDGQLAAVGDPAR